MKTNIRYLDFDSSLFGYKVGSAIIYNLNKEKSFDLIRLGKKEKYRLIYCYPKDEKSALFLNDLGAKIVDHKCLFIKDKLENQSINPSIESYSNSEKSDFLVQLTLQSGEFSRFKTDSKFKQDEFEKLYSLWIKKSIDKEIADDIIVYYEKQIGLGFISYKIKDKICDLSLIAVDRRIRNKGIGKMLMRKLENICYNSNIAKITVATQLANNTACQFYKSIGFKLINVETVYHLWI